MAVSCKSLLALSVSTLTILGASSTYAQVPSAAQTTADPGRIEQQIQAPDLSSDVQPSVTGDSVKSQKAPSGSDKITLTLKSITIEGNSTYAPEELSAIYNPSIGQTITLSEVYNIAERLTRKYRNDGYLLTQIVVPPQTIDGGHVKLRVVEGFVDRISVQGDENNKSLDLVRQYANQIKTDGNALNVKSLERALLLINDLPGVSARSVLSPSPTTTGAADITIIVERNPYDAIATLDNYGSRFLGTWQGGGAINLNSMLNMNETISLQGVIAPDTNQGKELGYVSLGYNQPIGPYGTAFNLSFSYTDTDPGFTLEPFEVEGQSAYYKVGLTHPIIRTRNLNLSSRVFFDARNVDSKNIVDATREDKIRAIRAGTRLEFLDTVFGVGVNSFDVELSKGLGLFGASDKNDQNLTRTLGNPQFFKAEFEAQRLQRLVKGFNLLVGAKGQKASSALLSSEEIGVGGMGYGRGFDPSEIVGDHGLLGKVELQWSPNHNPTDAFIEDYHFFTFLDAGRVWNDDATTIKDKRNTATSAGVGVRTEFMQDVNLDFTVAFPLNRDVQTQGDDDPRFLLGVRKGF